MTEYKIFLNVYFAGSVDIKAGDKMHILNSNNERWDDKQIKGTDGNSTTSTMNTSITVLHDKSVL